MSELRGLCLASTAVLHSLAEEQLWLHWLTLQGLLTRGPSLLSMPNKERCDRPRTFYPTQARRSCLEPAPFSWKRICRRTVSLLRGEVPKPTPGYSFRPEENRKWRTLLVALPPHDSSPDSYPHLWEGAWQVALQRRGSADLDFTSCLAKLFRTIHL